MREVENRMVLLGIETLEKRLSEAVEATDEANKRGNRAIQTWSNVCDDLTQLCE